MTNLQETHSKSDCQPILNDIAKIEWEKGQNTETSALIPSLQNIADFAQTTHSAVDEFYDSTEKIAELKFGKRTGEDEGGDRTKQTFEVYEWDLYISLFLPDPEKVPKVRCQNDSIHRVIDSGVSFAAGRSAETYEAAFLFIHKMWQEVREVHKETEHSFSVLVRAWQNEQTAKHISAEYDSKRPVSIASYPTGSIREVSFVTGDMARLREFATPDSIQQVENTQMQLFEDTPSILPPVTPLEIITPDEIPATTKSGAVSHTIRVFFEALMALEPHQTKADIMFTLGDFIQFLYPDGKFNRTNQLPHILDALKHLHYYATVPFDQGGGRIGHWRPVVVRTPLSSTPSNDDKIFLDVKLPPDAKQGMLIEKNIVRRVGKTSAPKFNAYFNAAWIIDKHGTANGKIIDPTIPDGKLDSEGSVIDENGNKLYTERGKIITDIYHPEAIATLPRKDNPKRTTYPILSNADLIASCFPNTTQKNPRVLLQRAKECWKELEAEGIVRIEKLPQGWRIMPSDRHVQLYRAMRKAQQRDR